MDKTSKDFLVQLLTTPSPTGYEEKIQKLVREYAKSFAETVTTDLHGNVIMGINTSAKRRIMLAGHCDQIGFMVKHITNDGFIYVAPLGGIDTGVLPGSMVTIYTERGPINGIFGRKPIHSQTPEERGKLAGDLDKLWIDIGAKDKKEVEKKVQIGDSATFKLGVTELGDDFIVSPGLDDRVGLFVVVEALRLAAKKKLSVALYSVSTVQEEIGLRGAKTAAYAIDPEVGIAIDVTHASDNPGNGENNKSVPCKLGSGPAIVRGPNANPEVEKLLIATAKKNKINYQLSPSPSALANDANAIQVTRGGVAAASLGIPNRYMHTQVEVCSLKDLEASAKLLSLFVAGITAKTDFTPRVYNA